MRRCSDCRIEKENEEFAFENKSLGKLQRRCRSCMAKRTHAYYEKNKTKVRSNMKKRRTFLSNLIQNKKHLSGCVFCFESEPVVLDYHHVDDKLFNISRMVRDRLTIEAIEAEIEKCVVVCANCHRKLHAGLIFLK